MGPLIGYARFHYSNSKGPPTTTGQSGRIVHLLPGLKSVEGASNLLRKQGMRTLDCSLGGDTPA